MDTTLLGKALAYKHWADRRTVDAVRALDPAVSPGTLAFARQQLNHLVRVEENFRARLLGTPEPHASTNTEALPALDDLDQRLAASNHWLAAHIAALSPPQLDEVRRFSFVDGQRGAMTVAEILFHLVNHGTYHRGAIGHALDVARGHRPADTYTVFIHAAEPQRRDG